MTPVRHVTVREVGLGEALQGPARPLPTVHRITWLQRAHEAGLREFDLGAFVAVPEAAPHADTTELLAVARRLPGLVAAVRVSDLDGARSALDSGADVLRMALPACRPPGPSPQRRTSAEVLARIGGIRALLDRSGSACLLEVGLDGAFGCTLHARVDEDEVLRGVRAVLDAGADRIGLVDTAGVADPLQVGRLVERCVDSAGPRLGCGRFRDERGFGLANVYAAWLAGVRRFDACLGGLDGGSRSAGACGIVATERVADLSASMGSAGDLDIEALRALRAQVAGWLGDDPSHGGLQTPGR